MKRFISIILALLLLTPIPVLAFTFRIQSNMDERVLYYLYERDHQLEAYTGMIVQRAVGELDPGETWTVGEVYHPGVYYLTWENEPRTWKMRMEIEVDPSVSGGHTVTVELNPVIIEIRIYKSWH